MIPALGCDGFSHRRPSSPGSELALPFDGSGSYRGYVEEDGIVYTALYDETYRSA